ncbi:hypothetical protein L1887_27847 [Cichorium endivia]|nr:hypothetical protein L1887_27847 [Cichorium endivia]
MKRNLVLLICEKPLCYSYHSVFILKINTILFILMKTISHLDGGKATVGGGDIMAEDDRCHLLNFDAI